MSVDIRDAEYSYLLPSFARVATSLVLSTNSNALGSDLTSGVYLMSADVDAYIVQGSSPTANVDHWLLYGGSTYPVRIDSEKGLRLAARTVTGSGTLRLLRVD